jgi:methyl-accepting chemotaxis protein
MHEMTARNDEVSTDARQAGVHASEVVANTRGLNTAVGELRQSVVRTVRTSVAEVDRRMFRRHAVDLPCRIEVAGQASQTARIVDLSEGGAHLTGVAAFPVGTPGALRLDRIGVPLPFKVLDSEGVNVRVAFATEAPELAELRTMLEQMTVRPAA